MREPYIETRGPEEIYAARGKIADQVNESQAAYNHLQQNPRLARITARPEDFVPYQEGHPIAAEAIKPVAEIADSRFDDMLAATDRQMNIVKSIGRGVLKGDNINVLTSHGELIDPGLVLAALSHYLGKLGLDDKPTVNIFEQGVKRGIVVTQAINGIGIRLGSDENPPLPLQNALKMLCDHIWKSYPPTPSMLGLRDDPETNVEIKANNGIMLDSIEQRQDDGKVLLAMAPSGRQDRPDEIDGPTIMHRVNSGTTELLTNGKATTVFVAVWLQESAVVVEFLGKPKRITNPAKIHKGMTKMATVLTERTDHNFEYDAPASTTLSQRLKTGWRRLKPLCDGND